MTTPSLRRTRIARAISLAVALGIWFVPPPGTLSPQAWHLFAIFAATILSVVIGAFPILTASVLALAAAVLSGTLSPQAGYAGFANPTIVLIVMAFLVARTVVKCGLGERLGYVAITLFGKSHMDASMLPPLWAMVIGTHVWFVGSLLARARADNLRREAGKDWVAKLARAES